MRRRDFMMLFGSAVLAPSAPHAQEKGRIYRLGSSHLSPRGAPYHVAFYDADGVIE